MNEKEAFDILSLEFGREYIEREINQAYRRAASGLPHEKNLA